MVNAVVADGQAEQEALKMAGEIAARGPLAVRAAKLAIDQGLGLVSTLRAFFCVIVTPARVGGWVGVYVEWSRDLSVVVLPMGARIACSPPRSMGGMAPQPSHTQPLLVGLNIPAFSPS